MTALATRTTSTGTSKAAPTATGTTQPTTTTTTKKTTSEPVSNDIGVWSKAFVIQRPVDSDLIPPLLAVSSGNGIAVGAGTTDENNTPSARADLVTGTAKNVFSGRQLVTGAMQVLAITYRGTSLNLLTGTSPIYTSCCSSVGVQTTTGNGQFGQVQPLASGLLGDSTGALVPVHSGTLAAISNQAGVWITRSVGSTYGGSDQLSGADQEPPIMAAAPLADGGAVVAWTSPSTGTPAGTGTTTTITPGATTTTGTTTTFGLTYPVNQDIYYATLPVHAGGLTTVHKLAITVAANRQIEAISLAEHNNGATIAWTESWFSGSTYESQVDTADLNGPDTVGHPLSSTTTTAVGVSLASAGDGREVAAWQACDSAAGTCQLQAALRPHGGAWGPVQVLGAIDPTSFPVAAASTSNGESLVAWTDKGDVYAMSAGPGATVFNTPVQLSKDGDDSDVQLAFSSGKGDATAIWQEGVVHPEIVGARFDPLTYTRTVIGATGRPRTVTTSTVPAPTPAT